MERSISGVAATACAGIRIDTNSVRISRIASHRDLPGRRVASSREPYSGNIRAASHVRVEKDPINTESNMIGVYGPETPHPNPIIVNDRPKRAGAVIVNGASSLSCGFSCALSHGASFRYQTLERPHNRGRVSPVRQLPVTTDAALRPWYPGSQQSQIGAA